MAERSADEYVNDVRKTYKGIEFEALYQLRKNVLRANAFESFR